MTFKLIQPILCNVPLLIVDPKNTYFISKGMYYACTDITSIVYLQKCVVPINMT